MSDQRIGNRAIPLDLQLQLTQFAMDNASICIYWLGDDAQIYYANKHACTVLGYTRNEILQLSLADLDPNYPMQQWNDHWLRLKRQQTGVVETLHRCKGGVILPVEVAASYVCLGDHEFVVAFAMDISERKRAESALREKEEFFRMISENVDDFIAVLDLEGRRIYNNPSYAGLFGGIEALKGTDSFNEIHPDDREHIRQLFRKTVQTGIGHKAEFRFVLPDGSIRYMESTGGLIKDGHGRALRMVVVSHDVTERKRTENIIYDLAFHDPLTKLPNRRLMQDRLEQVMAMSKRSGLYSALMFLDMDNFKPLNDEHGHDAGDVLLVEVASRLRNCVREMDTVARFGGDEFMVLLNELDADRTESASKAAAIAEKIRATLAEPYLIRMPQKERAQAVIEHRCTSSIGVAMFVDHTRNVDDVIRCADKAMYQAKEAGRNRVQFHDARD